MGNTLRATNAFGYCTEDVFQSVNGGDLQGNWSEFRVAFDRYQVKKRMRSDGVNLHPLAPPDAVQFNDKGIQGQSDLDKAFEAIHRDLEAGNITSFSYVTDGLISTPGGEHGYHASVITGREYLKAGDPLIGVPKTGVLPCGEE
jgi:hypothetical protein